MDSGIFLWLILLLPVAGSGLCRVLKSSERILTFILAGVLADAVICVIAACLVFIHGKPLTSMGGWLYADSLSAYHLIVMAIVYGMSSVYGRHYFDEDIRKGLFGLNAQRRYGSLWFASLGAMTLVLVSNNMGIMWVGMEATTLVTAFLICINSKKAAIEAMWKYLIVCSVGIAFAFLGTILVAAATSGMQSEVSDTLFWTNLSIAAKSLNPTLIKASFIFALVGYGTKAGLAPMHTWLPDAHSQAPTPVSAIFSGFMLTTALYCIMRHMALVNRVLGTDGFTNDLMIFFGIISIIVAAAFILVQHDLKRLLAYHSVEHLGIIAFGLGLGHLGVFAALFHTLNHSVCKSLGFFCAGSLGKNYETYDMRRISGAIHVSPIWGGGLLGSLLALIGVAPFALFISELLIVKSAIESHDIVALVFFLIGSSVVFVAALQHLIPIVWGEPSVVPSAPERGRFSEVMVVILSLGLLLVLGLWMPQGMKTVLEQAANIVGGAL